MPGAGLQRSRKSPLSPGGSTLVALTRCVTLSKGLDLSEPVSECDHITATLEPWWRFNKSLLPQVLAQHRIWPGGGAQGIVA